MRVSNYFVNSFYSAAAGAGGCPGDPGRREDGLAHSCWGRGMPRRPRVERGWIGSQLLGQGDANVTQGGERMDWLTAAGAGGCPGDPGWREDGLAHSCWGREMLWIPRVGSD